MARGSTSQRDRPRTHRPLLDYRGAAAYTRMSVVFLRRKKAEGEIEFVKMGAAVRFDPDVLDAFIDAHRRKG